MAAIKLQFPDTQLQISDRRHYRCSKFGCAHKFLYNGKYLTSNLVLLKNNFSTKKKFSNDQNALLCHYANAVVGM